MFPLTETVVAILKNVRHYGKQQNLAGAHSQNYYLGPTEHLYQIWCFYHKSHNLSKICLKSAALLVRIISSQSESANERSQFRFDPKDLDSVKSAVIKDHALVPRFY